MSLVKTLFTSEEYVTGLIKCHSQSKEYVTGLRCCLQKRVCQRERDFSFDIDLVQTRERERERAEVETADWLQSKVFYHVITLLLFYEE